VKTVSATTPVAKTTIDVPIQAEVEGKRLQATACNQNGTSSGSRQGVQRSM
jgi:hypothetical protein